MIHIAEHKGTKDSVHNIEITDKCITSEELDSFYDNFKFYYNFNQIKEINDISIEEFNDLSNFLSQDQLNRVLRTKGVKPLNVLQTGNKLLLNYCTAIKILVDKIESYLKQNQAEELKGFKEFYSNLYDNEFSYRFFMKLRDYIIHRGMPLTKVTGALDEDCNLYMGRDNLLEWHGWHIVKKDIEKMDADIAIQPFIKDIEPIMYAVYLQGLYYQAPKIMDSVEKINEFSNEHQVRNFDFVEFDKPEDFKNNNYRYLAVPWDQLLETINELNKHPNINIRIQDSDNET